MPPTSFPFRIPKAKSVCSNGLFCGNVHGRVWKCETDNRKKPNEGRIDTQQQRDIHTGTDQVCFKMQGETDMEY